MLYKEIYILKVKIYLILKLFDIGYFYPFIKRVNQN